MWVVSSYIGARPSVIFEPNVAGSVGVGLELGMETYLTNRIYLLKEADGSVIANWANLKDINVFSRVFAKLLLARLNVLKTEYKLSSRKDRVFEFDLNSPREKKQLLSNLMYRIPIE